jgi:MFS family permease
LTGNVDGVGGASSGVFWWHTEGMPARYNPDHTAHIRRRLVNQAIYGIGGLFFTAAAAGVLLLIGQLAGDAPAALWRLVWIADAVLGAVSLLFLAVTAVMWLVYRRRRAELDAQGAEIVGEFKARLATRRRQDPQ